MSLPDTFTASNGTVLSTYDVIWVQHTSYGSTTLEIQSNAVKVKAGSASSCYFYNSASSANSSVYADMIKPDNSSTACGVCGRLSSSANTMYLARLNLAAVELYKAVAGTFTLLGTVAHGMTNGVAAEVRLTMSGTTIKALVAGVEKISVTDSAVSAAGFSGIRINANSTISADNFNCTDLGPTYTLAAGSGSFVETGTNAALKFNRILPAASGSFQLSGTNASLKFNRALSAETGNIPLAGTDAALKFNRALTAAAGSFALAGADAALKFNRVLATDSGDIPLSGVGASLKFNRALALDAGSITLSGADATLAYTPAGGPTYTLAAGSGAFAASGTDASIKFNRVLSAGSGGIVVSGDDATLTHSPAVGSTSNGSGGWVRRGRRSHGFIGLSDIAAPPTPLVKISGRAFMREAPDTFYVIGEVYESPEQVRARVNSRTIAMLTLV